MSAPSISLELPTELYERIQEAAQNSNRTVESVVIDNLTLIFGRTQKITPDLPNAISDDQPAADC